MRAPENFLRGSLFFIKIFRNFNLLLSNFLLQYIHYRNIFW